MRITLSSMDGQSHLSLVLFSLKVGLGLFLIASYLIVLEEVIGPSFIRKQLLSQNLQGSL